MLMSRRSRRERASELVLAERFALAATVFVATLVASATNSSAVMRVTTSSAPAPTVILYGDSLADEARDVFTGALDDAGVKNVQVRAFGGTALCDWFGDMRDDLATVHPDVV